MDGVPVLVPDRVGVPVLVPDREGVLEGVLVLVPV